MLPLAEFLFSHTLGFGTEEMVGVRHPDFEKIHAAFLQHYSRNLQLGEESKFCFLACSYSTDL